MLEVKRSVTVNRSPEEVYRFWREFENLPRFMQHLEAVRTSGGTRTHWVAKGPAGATVEWDAETVEDRPNERLSWRSLAGSDVRNEGVVRFVKAPADRGTGVHARYAMRPPPASWAPRSRSCSARSRRSSVEQPVQLLHISELISSRTCEAFSLAAVMQPVSDVGAAHHRAAALPFASTTTDVRIRASVDTHRERVSRRLPDEQPL